MVFIICSGAVTQHHLCLGGMLRGADPDLPQFAIRALQRSDDFQGNWKTVKPLDRNPVICGLLLAASHVSGLSERC